MSKSRQGKAVTAVRPQSSIRYYTTVAVIMLLGLAVASRLVYLQIIQKDFLQNEGDKRVVRTETIPAYRGIIQDRHGDPLAVSTPVTSLWGEPQKLLESRDKWRLLSKKLNVSEERLSGRILRNQNQKFIYLKRHMAPHKAADILAMNLKGVHGLTEYHRYFPAGEIAAHIVGFTNIDDQGQEGMELSYDDHLKGYPGKKRVIKDLYGRVVKDIGLIANAQPGNDLQLSIDLRAQYFAYKELLTAVKEYRATSGTVVALDINTGEVLAMASQPSYNPNRLNRNDVPNFRNRAVTDVFEPGSTVKPFAVAAALESDRWYPDSIVDTSPGFLAIGKKKIRDSGNYGRIDIRKIISKSSNVGVSKLALSLQENAISDMYRRVGLGAATGIGFPGESAGILPLKDHWRPIEVATLSYGYGLSVTALQLAQAYSVIGSGGLKRPVSLLKLNNDTQAPPERVMDQDIAQQLLTMMEAVTEKGGTAPKARVPGYRVVGKTGTVHKSKSGTYEDHHYQALFAGVAPVDNPQIALVVVIDDPKGDYYYGGDVAAPVFSRVMSGLLRLRNVPPDRATEHWVKSRQQGDSLTFNHKSGQ